MSVKDRCAGKVGDALLACRLMEHAGESIPKWMGGIAVLFGLLILWQPLFLALIVGGMLIITGLVGIFVRKTVIIPVIMLAAGVTVLMFPQWITYIIAFSFIVVGLIFGLMRTTNKMRKGIGLAGALVGLIIFVYPVFLATIVGLALLVLGFIIVVGGLEE